MIPTIRNRVKPAPPPQETCRAGGAQVVTLPLIIGVLLALALAYFVLQRFMADDTTVVEGDTTTVTTTEPAPETTTAPPSSKNPKSMPRRPEAEAAADNAAAEAEAAAESASEAADDAAAGAADA